MYTAVNIKGTESRFGSYNLLNMYGYATSEALKPQKILGMALVLRVVGCTGYVSAQGCALNGFAQLGMFLKSR